MCASHDAEPNRSRCLPNPGKLVEPWTPTREGRIERMLSFARVRGQIGRIEDQKSIAFLVSLIRRRLRPKWIESVGRDWIF